MTTAKAVIQVLRQLADSRYYASRRSELQTAAETLERISAELDEWRNIFPGETPQQAAEIVKEVIIRLENYQAQSPLTAEQKAWAES